MVIQVIQISSNLSAGDVSIIESLIRQAWSTSFKLRSRIARLIDLTASQTIDGVTMRWSVTVNKEASYTQWNYATFKVRDGFIYKKLTVFRIP